MEKGDLYSSTGNRRKSWFALAIFVAYGISGACQANVQDPYSEKLVSAFIAAPEGAVVFSMQEKAMNRLGDGAAIGLIRHAGTQAPKTKQEVQRILSVIRMAFATPQIISTDADREPKATILFLSYLSFLPISHDLKQEIESTRTYVEHQADSYKIKHKHEER